MNINEIDNLEKHGLKRIKTVKMSLDAHGKDSIYEKLVKDRFKIKNKMIMVFLYGIIMGLTAGIKEFPLDYYDYIISYNKENKKYVQNNFGLLNKFDLTINCFFPLFAGYIIDYTGYHLIFVFLFFPIIFGSLINLTFTYRFGNHLLQLNENFELLFVGKLLFSFSINSIKLICRGATFNYFLPSGVIPIGMNLFMGYQNIVNIFLKFIAVYFLTKEIDSNEPKMEYYFSYCGFFCTVFAFLLCLLIVSIEIRWNKIARNNISLYDSGILEHKNAVLGSFLNNSALHPFSCWQSFQKMINFRIVISSVIFGIMMSCLTAVFNYDCFPRLFEVDPMINYHDHTKLKILSGSLEMSTSFISAILFCFFIGNTIQKTKNKFLLSLIGCLLCGFSYTCYSFVMGDDEEKVELEFLFIKIIIIVVATICLGVGISFYLGSFYSYFPLLAQEKTLFTAFGFLSCVNSIVSFFFMILIEKYYENRKNFERIFIFFCLGAILMIIILEMYERRYRNKLNEGNINVSNCELYLSEENSPIQN